MVDPQFPLKARKEHKSTAMATDPQPFLDVTTYSKLPQRPDPSLSPHLPAPKLQATQEWRPLKRMINDTFQELVHLQGWMGKAFMLQPPAMPPSSQATVSLQLKAAWSCSQRLQSQQTGYPISWLAANAELVDVRGRPPLRVYLGPAYQRPIATRHH